MLAIDVDTARLVNRLNAVERRQLPYATSRAINDTAKIARKAMKAEMGAVFDAPTSFTLNATMQKYATKARPVAELFLRNEATKGTPPVEYLLAEVKGQGREAKRSEKALRAAGMLGPSEFTVIGKDAKVNKFGNLTGGTYNKILSQVSAQRDPQQNSPRWRRGKQYFVSRGGPGLKQRGVYERYGRKARKARPVLIFTDKQPTYQSRLHFTEVARQSFERAFPTIFRTWLKRALRTAKP